MENLKRDFCVEYASEKVIYEFVRMVSVKSIRVNGKKLARLLRFLYFGISPFLIEFCLGYCTVRAAFVNSMRAEVVDQMRRNNRSLAICRECEPPRHLGAHFPVLSQMGSRWEKKKKGCCQAVG